MIIGTQKGTIILTTSQILNPLWSLGLTFQNPWVRLGIMEKKMESTIMYRVI